MKASLQLLPSGGPIYVLRVHPEGDYGSPYTASATVCVADDVATIYGLTSRAGFSPAAWNAVQNELHRLGVRRGYAERLREDGTMHQVPWKVKETET